MRQLRVITMLALVLSLAAFSGACKKPPVTAPPPPAKTPVVEAPPPPPPKTEVEEPFKPAPVDTKPVEPSIDELNRQGVLATVYFAFDKYDLDETARATLKRNAQWLKDNPGYRIVIEGHCDERGTIEYNLALGERRANAAREYIAGLGVSASNIRIVTFGEERPADPGHNEAAWAKNRRGEFKIESRTGS